MFDFQYQIFKQQHAEKIENMRRRQQAQDLLDELEAEARRNKRKRKQKRR